MITIPNLDPVTDILDTDKVMITQSDGTSYTISGAALNKRNQVIIASTKTVTGTPLKTGNVVRIYFTADLTAANANTPLVINYNSVDKTVKVPKNGALADYVAFEVATSTYKYLQAYTLLELIYDGTNFVIAGNPLVLSGTDYSIFADGLKRVDEVSDNKGMITSAAVNEVLNSPQCFSYSNNSSNSKIIHLGRFDSGNLSGRSGLILELESRRADGAIKTIAIVNQGKICNVRLDTRFTNSLSSRILLYKSDDYIYDLYLYCASYTQNFIRINVPLYYTHDGSEVNDYIGTLVDEIQFIKAPVPPAASGTYTLKCSVSGGVPTFSWE